MTTQEGSRFFVINVVVIAIVDYRFYIRGCFVLGVIIVVCFFFFYLGPLSSLTTKTLESHQFQESYEKKSRENEQEQWRETLLYIRMQMRASLGVKTFFFSEKRKKAKQNIKNKKKIYLLIPDPTLG